MATEKRNTFLDAEESEDDGVQGYDSEADERGKGLVSRTAKRRTLEDDDSSDEDDDGDDADDADDAEAIDSRFKLVEDDEEFGRNSQDKPSEGRGKKAQKNSKKRKHAEGDEEDGNDDSEDSDRDHQSAAKHKPKKAKTAKKAKRAEKTEKDFRLPGESLALLGGNIVNTEKAVRRSGVVYLSRIPPFMKPSKLRSLLEPYGEINRIFLSPEDPKSHTRRVKAGGNKKRSFVDGWVEFVRKKDAKTAVDLLNGQTIGGKKGTFYRDDIWSLVYLHGFKWHHLTTQVAQENAERENRTKAEIAKAKKENEAYLANVARSKMISGIEAKRKAKKAKADATTGGGTEAAAAAAAATTTTPSASSSTGPVKERKMIFKQVALAKTKTSLEAQSRETVPEAIF